MLEALAYFEASLRLEERAPNPARRSRYASYYGYCLAAALGQTREGLSICRRAAASEFFTPDVLLNLARVQLLMGVRKQAWETLTKALSLDPDHRGVRATMAQMGLRRRPAIPFLGRSNPLNRAAGKRAVKRADRARSRTRRG
jgi:Tfp pilus assembly protein PilF